MVVAQASVHAKNGFFAQKNGIELGAVYSAGGLALASAGFRSTKCWAGRCAARRGSRCLQIARGIAAACLILTQRTQPEPAPAPPAAAGEDRPVPADLPAAADGKRRGAGVTAGARGASKITRPASGETGRLCSARLELSDKTGAKRSSRGSKRACRRAVGTALGPRRRTGCRSR
jgi:hypothetical protein